MRAIQQTEFGGPEVLALTQVERPDPASGEVLIEVTRSGVNFADVHARENKYIEKRSLPLIPGAEVAGIRSDTGERVVAHCSTGGYAEWVTAPARHTFAIPDAISDDVALALFVQGVTAFHLYATAARPLQGDAVVVFSGAGGTGSLLIALARRFGAGRVIATASSADKRTLCEQLGADVAIDGDAGGLGERLLAANSGRAVDVIFDPSGGAVFDAAFEALAEFGRIVVYGIATGEPNELRTSSLLRGSKSVAGFRLSHALERPEMMSRALSELFAAGADGTLDPRIGGVYPLADAARAQTDLRNRKTTGKLLLDARR